MRSVSEKKHEKRKKNKIDAVTEEVQDGSIHKKTFVQTQKYMVIMEWKFFTKDENCPY